MMLHAVALSFLLGLADVGGKAVVRTASELADAIRGQEGHIFIESRITGIANEQLAQNSGVYALERYDDFPEIPEQCLMDPEPCLSDETYVHLSVPTVFTSTAGALWDVGFLRRRLLVSQNVTIDSMRLQGIASDVMPYIFFFLFANDASLNCVRCTVEHTCGGGDASFFLQSMGLAALSQTVMPSADGMSAVGTVTLRAAQDVAAGTRSTQAFLNGTFQCVPALLRGVPIDTTVRPEETCQRAADEGRSYRGTKNTTRSGFTCQRWDATEPIFHSRIPTAFPQAGLTDNFCRNPDNEDEVWCYTVDGPRFEYCGVPLCDESAEAAAATSSGVVAVEEPEQPVGPPDDAPSGDDGADPRTAVLAGVLAAVMAALVAVAAVAFLLHRRRRRWCSAQHDLCATSTGAKRVLYGESHSGGSEAADDDGSCGADGSRKMVAVIDDDAVAVEGTVEAKETPAAGGDAGSAGNGSDSSRRSSRSGRHPPAEELREALAEMEVDASQLVLHELVGRGGFGSVYRGTWRGLNVAVKTVTFQERGGCGGGAQARAIAEAAITFSLSHPHVIATYFHEIKPLHVGPEGAADEDAAGSTHRHTGAVGAAVMNDERLQDWKLFLVQEFCEGGSLRNLVDRRGFVNQLGRVKLRKCVECLVDVAQGMRYIQEKQIIHGDLTPSNVLIRPHAPPTPTASRQGSTPAPPPECSSLGASKPLPLPGPPSTPPSGTTPPRAWHMLSGAPAPPPHHPASTASHPASSSATPLHGEATAWMWNPSESMSASSPAWHSPTARSPATPARDADPDSRHGQPVSSSVSESQFHTAVESMAAHGCPTRAMAPSRHSAAAEGVLSPRRDAPAATAASGDAEAMAARTASSSTGSGSRGMGGARAMLTLHAEECFTHIDAAVPSAERAEEPTKLALTLHQPARQYQELGSSSPSAAVVAWDTEPWQATAKVSDFGLSMKLDPSAGHISNVRQGTPFYSAPEVRDAGFLSKAADTFAFGVIMWECFHCTAPYHVNRSGRFVRHPSFPNFPKDCPLSFAVLAVSCLAPNPADRPDFSQICGVLADLAAHLRGAGDAATSTAHLTLTEVETHTGSPAGAVPASCAADDAGSAITGILSRAGANLADPGTSDSDLSILGSGRPLPGHSSSPMQSMQDVIRSVTAGRAADRAHLLATGRHGLPLAGAGSSLSHSWSRSASRPHAMHSASASPSHASTASTALASASSWHAAPPRSYQEAIPEEDPEQQSGTVESSPGQ